jgi:hypothetical protein
MSFSMSQGSIIKSSQGAITKTMLDNHLPPVNIYLINKRLKNNKNNI